MTSRRTLTAAGLVLAMGAAGAAAAQELTVGTKLELSTLDPHFFASFPSGTSHSYLFDRFVALDDDLNLVPGLAESWEAREDGSWLFRLRQGVTFHDGSAFDAEDVIATFERVPNVPDTPNSFAKYVRAISEIEVVDPHTIILHTSQPTPSMPRDLSNVVIIPAEAREQTTQDFNNGNVVGTGPYELVEWRRGEALILERNDDYWGELPAWSDVTERVLANDGARTAALLAGDVDVIDYAPVEDIPRLQESPEFTVSQGPLARIHYIAMDSSRSPTPHVNPDGENPLVDARVRRALSVAINREAIVERLLLGLGEPASQLLPKSFFGSSQELSVDPYAPDLAKSLLAEAGWGDGFSMTFHATNARYPADVEIAQAIAQMWSRIGLDVQVEALARTIFFPQATNFEFSIYTAQYGTEDNLDMAISMIRSRDEERGLGNGNRARFTNPEVDEVIDQAAVELDDAKRAALLAEAYEIAIGEHGVIPLYHPAFVVAARDGLDVAIRANGRLTAMRITAAD